jgi:hypothetical protein
MEGTQPGTHENEKQGRVLSPDVMEDQTMQHLWVLCGRLLISVDHVKEIGSARAGRESGGAREGPELTPGTEQRANAVSIQYQTLIRWSCTGEMVSCKVARMPS